MISERAHSFKKCIIEVLQGYIKPHTAYSPKNQKIKQEQKYRKYINFEFLLLRIFVAIVSKIQKHIISACGGTFIDFECNNIVLLCEK